jgi:hypothetical protein
MREKKTGWRAIAATGCAIWVGVGMAGAQTATQSTNQNAARPAAQGAASAPAQSEARSTQLTVAGYDGRVPIIHRNGHAYVELEGLAEVTGSTLGFQGKTIVLNLPAPAPVVVQAAVPAPAPSEQEPKGFTRDFLRAGVEQMTVVREWRSAVENAVRTNNPVDESWVSGYRQAAQSRMAMAQANATTDADRQALPLLESATSMVGQLTDRFLALRKTVSYVDPKSLDDDDLDKKITACAQGMAAMAIPGGQFQDVNACH